MLNAGGGWEATVTTRIDWVRFKECEGSLLGNRFLLKMKSKAYHCCVRLAIWNGV